MPTQCNPNRFAFAPAEGRPVVASFDGGAITSEAGALLLGATDRMLGLTRRLAACFTDSRDPAYTEHTVETLVMQRVVGIALGYEDLNDHDELRHDPVLATLAGKLTASRSDGAPLAGKSTLNRFRDAFPAACCVLPVCCLAAPIPRSLLRGFFSRPAKLAGEPFPPIPPNRQRDRAGSGCAGCALGAADRDAA